MEFLCLFGSVIITMERAPAVYHLPSTIYLVTKIYFSRTNWVCGKNGPCCGKNITCSNLCLVRLIFKLIYVKSKGNIQWTSWSPLVQVTARNPTWKYFQKWQIFSPLPRILKLIAYSERSRCALQVCFQNHDSIRRGWRERVRSWCLSKNAK